MDKLYIFILKTFPLSLVYLIEIAAGDILVNVMPRQTHNINHRSYDKLVVCL